MSTDSKTTAAAPASGSIVAGAASAAGAGAGVPNPALAPSLLPWMTPLPRGSAAEVVVVTGATGFIGSHIIKLLLEATDYRVRGTVRSSKKVCTNLQALQNQYPGRLTVVDGCDLLHAGSYDGAVAGATFVVHTAATVAFTAADKKRDIIDPAIDGTRNVLEACARSGGSVRRFVLTSSTSAVASDTDHGRTLTEADWNKTARVDHDEYGYAKTESEKLAYQFVAALPVDRAFQVVVLNPALVLGPLLTPDAPLTNGGLTLLSRLLNRQLPALPRFKYGLVDVRDVARAHVAALTSTVAPGQRYIVTGPATLWLPELGRLVRAQFPEYNAPTSVLPDWAMYVSVWLGIEKQIDADGLRWRLGRDVTYDTTKLRREFAPEGLHRLIDVDTTVHDAAQSLIAARLVRPGPSVGTKLLYATGAVVTAVAAAAAAAWYFWPSTPATATAANSTAKRA